MSGFTREKQFKTRSPAGTLAIASKVAEILAAPRVVILRGDLGAGKTTLAKGWISAIHAASEDDVTSPTFTLVHEYTGPLANVFHLDLYRLQTESEVDNLGLEEMAADQKSLVLIEWGEKFAKVRELADAEVAITQLEGDERSIYIRWR